MEAIILAPHPDDEVIGCFSLLEDRKVTDVFYFYDLNPNRIDEAYSAADRFGFKPHFGHSSRGAVEADVAEALAANPLATVLLPAITDDHPHHKAVNRQYRGVVPHHRRMFYSVDLQHCPGKVRANVMKRSYLDTDYRSQRSLWENDASYYLFECIRTFDYTRLQVKSRGDIRIWEPYEGAATYLDRMVDELIAAEKTPFQIETSLYRMQPL